MATEQEVREEVKQLHQQVNDLVADLQRERDNKTIAKKQLYGTLEKYEPTLRFFRKLMKKTSQAFTKKYDADWELTCEGIDRPEVIDVLKAHFPQRYGQEPTEDLLFEMFQEENISTIAFVEFLASCSWWLDGALDPEKRLEDTSLKNIVQLLAELDVREKGQSTEDAEQKWKDFLKEGKLED